MRALVALLVSLTIGATLLLSTFAASATALTPGSTWYSANCSTAAVDCVGANGLVNPGTAPWTFDGGAAVTIVDMFIPFSDQYSLFDFGSLVGTTTASAAGTSADCGTNPEAALLNPNCGSGVFWLGGGSHSLTIRLVQSEYTQSGMAFRVESVPAPATLALIGIGLAGLGVTRRRKAQ